MRCAITEIEIAGVLHRTLEFPAVNRIGLPLLRIFRLTRRVPLYDIGVIFISVEGPQESPGGRAITRGEYEQIRQKLLQRLN